MELRAKVNHDTSLACVFSHGEKGNRQIRENQTRPNFRNKNRQIAEPRSQILEYQKN